MQIVEHSWMQLFRFWHLGLGACWEARAYKDMRTFSKPTFKVEAGCSCSHCGETENEQQDRHQAGTCSPPEVSTMSAENTTLYCEGAALRRTVQVVQDRRSDGCRALFG